MKSSRGLALTQGFVALGLVFALIVFSEHGFKASLSGMKLFFDVVFPSLLPFFILSELLMALGMVHFLGVFFEPIMRPLFNVPGVGSFVLSMGLAAGYPMDAVLTAKFRKQNLCTKVEGERMLAFTNTADPLFIFGAVAVGMFGQPELGLALGLAHYASAFLVGLIFRFYGVRQEQANSAARPIHAAAQSGAGLWRRATDELLRAKREDGRNLGQVFNDAIRESIGTLFMIMSFMVLFSVLIAVLTATGLVHWLELPLSGLLQLFGFSPVLVNSALKGIFEIDLGTAAAAVTHAPLLQRVALCSGIIAWSGLSVHGQVASVLTESDISMRPYFLARALHAVLAILLTVAAVHLHLVSLPAASFFIGPLPTLTFATGLAFSLKAVLVALSALAGLAFLMLVVRSLRILRFRA